MTLREKFPAVLEKTVDVLQETPFLPQGIKNILDQKKSKLEKLRPWTTKEFFDAVDLGRKNFDGLDLSEVNFIHQTGCKDISFKGSCFLHQDFSYAEFCNCDFQGAVFDQAMMYVSWFYYCNFSNISFLNARAQGSIFKHCEFQDSVMNTQDFYELNIPHVKVLNESSSVHWCINLEDKFLIEKGLQLTHVVTLIFKLNNEETVKQKVFLRQSREKNAIIFPKNIDFGNGNKVWADCVYILDNKENRKNLLRDQLAKLAMQQYQGFLSPTVIQRELEIPCDSQDFILKFVRPVNTEAIENYEEYKEKYLN